MTAAEDDLRRWMRQALDGDEAAYRTLLSELQKRLHAYFSRRLFADASLAEDLVQETLMAIHRKRGTYDPGMPFTPWAFAIARYKLVDHLRRSPALTQVDESALDAIPSGETAADAAMARRDLEHMLSLVPPEQAAAIRLIKIDGFSASEAASKLGISESNVKVRVHRGLKAISRQPDRRGKP